jgi:hypothetical protein
MANSAHHDEQTVDGHGHGHGYGHGHAGIRGLLGTILRPHSHDAADSVDSALEASAAGVRAVKISLVALLVTGLAQAIIVVFTDSVALLADTIHNFSDAMTAIPLWVAFVLSRRSPTRRYTYGYGRAEDLAGILIVAMIALSAVVAGYDPPPVSPAAGHQHRRADRGRSDRFRRERVGCDLPHPSRAPDRLGGAGRRWPTRPY